METKLRIELIVSSTLEDFYNSFRSSNEDKETMIQWLSDDLMKLDDIEEFTTIEISLLTLKKLNCLDLVNLEFIIETIANDLRDSENEIIHIAIPKVL
jgi:predicted metalloendopeptidase